MRDVEYLVSNLILMIVIGSELASIKPCFIGESILFSDQAKAYFTL